MRLTRSFKVNKIDGIVDKYVNEVSPNKKSGAKERFKSDPDIKKYKKMAKDEYEEEFGKGSWGKHKK